MAVYRIFQCLISIVQNLQDLERRRIERIREFVRQGAEVERSIMPILNTCIDGMQNAATAMNPDEV